MGITRRNFLKLLIKGSIILWISSFIPIRFEKKTKYKIRLKYKPFKKEVLYEKHKLAG
jgi:hypothetical protein